MFLPASSKWTTGTIKQRKVHCYLYTNALVVVAGDKKVCSILRNENSVAYSVALGGVWLESSTCSVFNVNWVLSHHKCLYRTPRKKFRFKLHVQGL